MSALRNGNGILNFAAKRDGGVLALGNPTADNAILGYLAGALQGGNLGQSIGRGLEGFVAGTRLDEQRLAPAQTYAAVAAAGVPDALARAAALNRDVMKAIAPAYLGPAQSDTAAVSALNGAIGRLGDLMDTADTAADASPASGAYPQASADLARGPRAAELTQALRASGIGEDDIRALNETLAVASPPDARKAALGRAVDLVQSRLAELQARYGRGGKAPELLSPKSKAALDKLRQWRGGESPVGKASERTGAN